MSWLEPEDDPYGGGSYGGGDRSARNFLAMLAGMGGGRVQRGRFGVVRGRFGPPRGWGWPGQREQNDYMMQENGADIGGGPPMSPNGVTPIQWEEEKGGGGGGNFFTRLLGMIGGGGGR